MNARKLYVIPRGLGPYTGSRLCKETGGIFFVADDTTVKKWDPQIMRQYAPDYRPGSEYRRQVQSNLAKASLIAAAQLAVTEPVPIPQRTCQANNDNILLEQTTADPKSVDLLDFFSTRLDEALDCGEKHLYKLEVAHMSVR